MANILRGHVICNRSDDIICNSLHFTMQYIYIGQDKGGGGGVLHFPDSTL